MNTALRPPTLHALDVFRSRRRRLLLGRALLVFLLAALAAILGLALLDRLRWIPDSVRPWLTLGLYAGAFFYAWRHSIRLIREARDDEGAARLLEHAAPDLRERLLPAVELARPSSHPDADSPEFRATLQDQVALEVQHIPWSTALPTRSLRPPFFRLLLLALAIAALSFIPQLHLPGFLARASLPFVAIERPASVRIHILTPEPASTLAPFVSEQTIAAEITGRLGSRPVYLETREPAGTLRRHEMRLTQTERFEGSVPVGQTDVEYRIRAADGLTAWHLLTARARPAVVTFEKVITPPAYTGAPARTLSEPQGDIEALEGATVSLRLHLSEPVTRASIQLNPTDATPPAAIEGIGSAPDLITADFPITTDLHSWTPHLTAAETAFTNDDSSPWRITPLPDLPPTIALTEPTDHQQCRPDQAIAFSGLASDDVGLASTRLMTSLNGAEFSSVFEIPLKNAEAPTLEAPVQHTLNLGALRLTNGDSLLVQWQTTDLKGQTAESTPVRLFIQEETVDPRQREWLAAQQNLVRTATALDDLTADARDAASRVQKDASLAKKNQPAQDPEGQLARLRAALDESQTRANEMWDQLQQAAPQAPNDLAREQIRSLAERLIRLRRVTLPRLQQAATEPIASTDALRRAAGDAANLGDTLEKASQLFAAETAARIATTASEALRRQEARLTENALDSNRNEAQRTRWQEQQRAAATAAQATLQDLANLAASAPERSSQRSIEDAAKQLTEATNDLTASLDQPGQNHSPEHLYGAADNLRNRLEKAADQSRNAAQKLAERAAQLREQLNRQDNSALTSLNDAKANLQNAAAAAANPKRKPSKDSSKPPAQEQARQALTEAAAQLQDQADLLAQISEPGTAAPLDLNRLSRAAEQLSQTLPQAPTPANSEPASPEQAAQLKTASDSANQLQAAARTLTLQAEIDRAALATARAAQPQSPDAESQSLLSTAADAQAAAELLKKTTEPLRRDKETQDLSNLAQQAADQARNAARDLEKQANEAARNSQFQAHTVAASHEAAARTQQLLAAFTPRAEAARQALAPLTPQVSEMMKQLAADLHSASQQSENAADQARDEKPVAEVADQARELQPGAQRQQEQLQSLQAALRQEANAADLHRADERQLARTADVALEQMRQTTPEIGENLKQAAQATASQPQAESLQAAADAQRETGDALQQLAQNFAQMEQGQNLSEEQLAALRQMEQDLGVQRQLDEAYDRAQQLADLEEMAEEDPAAALALLEQELARNPTMQKSLAEIAGQTAQTTEATVNSQADQPAMLAAVTADAAQDLARVARHEDRLQNQPAADAVNTAADALQKTADAVQADIGQASPQKSADAKNAAQQASQTAQTAAAQTPPTPSANFLQQLQSTALAQALDQLDQVLHPANAGQGGDPGEEGQQGQQQPGQQGQQGQQQQSQQGAQQNLSDASQSQQQSMAQSRQQGKVPGSPSDSQNLAQNSNQPPADASAQQDGANLNPQGELGVLAGEVIIVEGDWGHLPAHTAADLTEATRQDAPPEYRAAIENYYKAIATKSRE
ncbi:MAG: hypothetical protein KDK99_06915 [Verrucomicrobiales bacterium]|nr:hypothetical protein [Verrucomicrobiales bacterium]